jgi:hypothetical protein
MVDLPSGKMKSEGTVVDADDEMTATAQKNSRGFRKN